MSSNTLPHDGKILCFISQETPGLTSTVFVCHLQGAFFKTKGAGISEPCPSPSQHSLRLSSSSGTSEFCLSTGLSQFHSIPRDWPIPNPVVSKEPHLSSCHNVGSRPESTSTIPSLLEVLAIGGKSWHLSPAPPLLLHLAILHARTQSGQ